MAVFGILIFLVEEVLPLFQGGAVTFRTEYVLHQDPGPSPMPILDEQRSIGITLGADGTIRAFHVLTGRSLRIPGMERGDVQVTAVAATPERGDLALGFSDGTVRLGKLAFREDILNEQDLPPGLERLDDRDSTDGQRVYSRISGGQIRRVQVSLGFEKPLKASPQGDAIAALDYRVGGMAERPRSTLAVMDRAGRLSLLAGQSKKNLLTGRTETAFSATTLPGLPREIREPRLLVTGRTDLLLVADSDGWAFRYNTHDLERPLLVEAVRLLPEGTRLTALGFLAGEQAIVVGGSDGSVGIYFRVARQDAPALDGHALVLARRMAPHGQSVTGFVASRQGKVFLTADAAGVLWMRHGTSEKTLLRLTGGAGQWRGVALSPRDDAVLALGADGKVHVWHVEVPHPETSLHTLFGKVWYEGHPGPAFTWQSSAATDVFEPKMSLVPLIFGTVKGTFYSLLFAVPIALLGAVFTSEFLHRRLRAVIKPVMEMMASLPSVVLGFVAALVLAPVVETWIAAVILAFMLVPVSLVGAAYLWQLLPGAAALRLQGVPKFLLMLVPVAAGLWGAVAAGPAFERFFFEGDFKLWAAGKMGGAAPFLFLLLMPLGMVFASLLASRFLKNRSGQHRRTEGRLRAGILSLARGSGVFLLGGAGAYGAAMLLESLGVDARGGLMGTYVQRNTLVVGFAMGFAVIPIVYTLAEDALSAVPEHLRAASLSCGATLWQTAVWVVVPTAMSGLFSAVMIGMGRAVGETMIVVMATGNTPIMDWNVFNGLRALSANIAVELPEAVKDGTLYRVLFLSGLVLFAMTFVINTLAEVIRQRFRKRAMQL